MVEPGFPARVAVMRELSLASQVQTGVEVIEQALDGASAHGAGRPSGRYNPVGP
jgi:hypothetical protein